MSERSEHTDNTTTTTSSADTDMNAARIPINPQRASTLVQNLSSVHARLSSALSALPPPQNSRPVRLVAVSKLKPASDILALHTTPLPVDTESSAQSNGGHAHAPTQAHFGENYVQELLEKSRLLPRSIKWHFIGGLQSNKCAQLAREVDSLWAVESCDSEKKASLLNKGRGERTARLQKEDGDNTEGATLGWDDEKEQRLRVFIQVNTSGEESKSGVEPASDELRALARYIASDESCPHLRLQGLMTIGAIARSKASTPETENEDFVTLKQARDDVAKELGLQDTEELELSMGMSDDFESAIRLGSSEVRVGSTIFGERPAKKDAKVVETEIIDEKQ